MTPYGPGRVRSMRHSLFVYDDDDGLVEKMASFLRLIPGTSSLRHLQENVAAMTVGLDDHDFQLISQI